MIANNLLLVGEHRIATVIILEALLGRLEVATDMPFRSVGLRDLSVNDLQPGTLPILVRGSSYESFYLARAMRRHHIPYAYYIDDNVWEIDPEHVDGRYWRMNLVTQRLDFIVGGAELILTATRPLKEYLLPVLGERVQHVDSFYDFSLIPDLPAKQYRRRVRGGFASSPGRAVDLAAVMPDILTALDKYPDLEFEVIGTDKQQLPDHDRLSWFPYLSSYEEYTRFQMERSWDFGIAPLSDTASNLYKTNNKYREYAAHGIPGIYEDEIPYAEVRDGVTGLLAGARRTWLAAIEMYVDSTDLRSRVRSAARRDAEQRFSSDAVVDTWMQSLVATRGVEGPVSKLAPTLRRIHRAYVNSSQTLLPKALRAAEVYATTDGIGPTALRSIQFLARIFRARFGRAIARLRR